MSHRISRDQAYMEIAGVIAKRGTCLRAKVGVVATMDGRVVAMGYNGSLPGEPHCTDESCTPESPCQNSVHAEANMIAFCARKGISLEGATVYCTHSPCRKCSELIIQAGIKEIVFLNQYRDTPWEMITHHGLNIRTI